MDNRYTKTKNTSTEQEPIAIVGIGCCFPGGGDGPQAFFQALKEGVNGITDIPADRWNIDDYYDPDPNKGGKVNTRKGGFIKNHEKFDAHFFSYFPKVAQEIDPQHRYALMCSYEAIEDAGIKLEDLYGSRTAVFMGDFIHDYYVDALDPAYTQDIGPHTMMGATPAATAGRISWAFNLLGPSVSLDTACSSSLVALHLACQSIWSGESDMGLAGGVNIMTSPTSFVALSKGNFLNPDGFCRSFDAKANGYVRGEAVGIVMLKKLSQAEADGNNIYALIRNSVVNSDGFTAEGITVPNGKAQERALQEAYSGVGINPADVDYVEAHGTGTKLGDPTEARAFGAVFAKGRAPQRPLLIGSVKSNIGHTEAGAGIAGVIKLAMALKYRFIPKSLHFKQPNPEIRFDEWKLQGLLRSPEHGHRRTGDQRWGA